MVNNKLLINNFNKIIIIIIIKKNNKIKIKIILKIQQRDNVSLGILLLEKLGINCSKIKPQGKLNYIF